MKSPVVTEVSPGCHNRRDSVVSERPAYFAKSSRNVPRSQMRSLDRASPDHPEHIISALDQSTEVIYYRPSCRRT